MEGTGQQPAHSADLWILTAVCRISQRGVSMSTSQREDSGRKFDKEQPQEEDKMHISIVFVCFQPLLQCVTCRSSDCILSCLL